MSRVILYDAAETEFSTHGLGVITDAIKCTVERGTDGTDELVLIYPTGGEMLSALMCRRIIRAKPSPASKPQPYRIYRISAPMNGRVKVYAHHLSYDTSGVIVAPCAADNAADAVKQINRSIMTECPFTLSTNMTAAGAFSVKKPCTLRECLMGEKDGLGAVYGAEFVFDTYHIRMAERVGSSKGAKIRYGVNLLDSEQEKSISNVYTGIYPFFYEETDGEETLVTLTGGVLNAEGNFGFSRILPVDLSSEFKEVPTEEQLEEAARAYLENHRIGVPEVNLNVVFANLREYEEYKDTDTYESIELGDTVSVIFDKQGISTTSRVVNTVYDSILDRYDNATIGETKYTAVDTLFTIENSVIKAISEAGAAGRGVAQVNVRVDEAEALVQLLTEWQTEAEKNIAEIEVKSNANEASISLIAEHQTETDINMAYIEAKVDDNAAEIREIAKWQTDTETNIAEISTKADANEASIEAKVSKTGGSTSTFAWRLLSDEFRVYSNGSTVFLITKDGAQIVGAIQAKTGKIGSYFNVTSKGMYYGNVLIYNDGLYIGPGAQNIESLGDSDIATTISADGQITSRHPLLYFPTLYGGVTVSGSEAAGHAINSNIPIILKGYDLSTHEKRIQDLEDALVVSNKKYTVKITVKYLDASGNVVDSAVDVNGTYANGSSFTYPLEKVRNGVSYRNTAGSAQTFTVNSADLNKTVTYQSAESDIMLQTGDSYSYLYDGSSPSVEYSSTALRHALPYTDDGGNLVFTAESSGSGTVTIYQSESTLATLSVSITPRSFNGGTKSVGDEWRIVSATYMDTYSVSATEHLSVFESSTDGISLMAELVGEATATIKLKANGAAVDVWTYTIE